MITKEMKEFMKKVKMDYEYNWFEDDNTQILDSDLNKNRVSLISYDGDKKIFYTPEGKISEEEHEKDYEENYYKDIEEYLKRYEEFDYFNDNVEGLLAEKGVIEISKKPKECEPGCLKFVLREFEISDDFDLSKPLIIFHNNGGDYGSPEIDTILVDNNCTAKMYGDIEYYIKVFLNKIPDDRKVHMLVQMSTCLDT